MLPRLACAFAVVLVAAFAAPAEDSQFPREASFNVTSTPVAQPTAVPASGACNTPIFGAKPAERRPGITCYAPAGKGFTVFNLIMEGAGRTQFQVRIEPILDPAVAAAAVAGIQEHKRPSATPADEDKNRTAELREYPPIVGGILAATGTPSATFHPYEPGMTASGPVIRYTLHLEEPVDLPVPAAASVVHLSYTTQR